MGSLSTIGILGGTGFVGTHLTAHLVKEGYRVRVLSRRPHRYRNLGLLTGVELVECDVFNLKQLRLSIKGCDAVINLVGILNQTRHQNLRRTHVALPGKLVEICKQQKIRRLLHVSALNAGSAATSEYLRSKGDGENLIHTSSGGDLKVTSFRPSVIFGPGDSFLNRFAGVLKLLPGPLPLACAKSRLAPVYVGDVVKSMVDALEDPDTFGARIELCGPFEYTLQELVELTARYTQQNKKVIGLPRWLSYFQATILGILPGKLFTLDNYRSMQTDSVCKNKTSCPTSIEVIAPEYLGAAGHEAKMQRFRENHS
ncbi:MAG TPA: complex I NDUFA9 subunit family protein [Gammaproteobacteria bacterium]|jgi:NADH dehydrogenase|nr:complex I NDUFA9 subunit family protein [Gammaproteobacteria bacterium]